MFDGILISCTTRDLNSADNAICVSFRILSYFCVIFELFKAWRRLPKIVSVAHGPLLRAAHQIVELNEAAVIHESLSQNRIDTDQAKEQIKNTVKQWKNRLALISDPLSHWSDLVTWHHHQYQAIVTQYEQREPIDQSILGMHASATDFIYYAQIARKHGQLTSALESLQLINQIPSVSVYDCYIRTIEQIKCYLAMKNTDDRNLAVIEETSLRYFKNPERAEILALKAKLQSKVKHPQQDPNRTFSQAVQLHDSVIAWGLWAEHLVSELDGASVSAPRSSVSQHAASALTALLQACRQQTESNCKRFMSNVIYCLAWDSETNILEVLDQCADSVPAIQWLSWIPQLVQSLCRFPPQISDENSKRRQNRLHAIIRQVAKKYTQAVYLPIRTQYLSLKMESKHLNAKQEQYSRQVANEKIL